ncbi:MAG: 1-acyl-sn-glycerol-3-phosphate acyltransferase [Bacteroidales bacterium]|jgi:putative hemolysin|nr:1-acyl-sn-glycerol-3-phosphate acyltransferase [Bacteroidales bacterium]
MAAIDTNSKNEVDVKELFYEKNPKLARWIPGFIYSYLRKIAHQDFINEVIRDYGHLRGYDFSVAMMEFFNLTVEPEGLETLPEHGRYIFVANHPLGGLEGHVIMDLIGKKYGPNKYKFLVNDLLMNLKNLHDVFIPVNKHGRQGTELAVKLDTAFKSEDQILTFPSGWVSRKYKGQVMDLEWKKSFINKAKQYQRDVIPIHIGGENSKFFYRLYKFRKSIGIKANIEMLYLMDETYKHRNMHISIKFGKPIPWQTFDNSRRPLEWAKWVKDVVYKIDGVENVPY